MQQARAAPGSASRRTHHAQKRGSLSKGCVSRAAHQTPLTSRKRPVNPGGNHIRANMVHASLVAGPLIIHVGRSREKTARLPRGRRAEELRTQRTRGRADSPRRTAPTRALE